MQVPMIVDAANIVLAIIAGGALVTIMDMTVGSLRNGWKLMLCAMALLLLAQVTRVLQRTGMLQQEVDIVLELGSLVLFIIALWVMIRAFHQERVAEKG